MCRINGLGKLGKEKIFEAGKQKIELIFFLSKNRLRQFGKDISGLMLL